MSTISTIENKAAELRNAFDLARAIPSSTEKAEAIENLLAISLSGDPYAIRVSEISALAIDKKVVGLPTHVPELLGVAGIRGSVVPVYNLAVLLGYTAAENQMHWLALCGTDEPVGLAFGNFEGYIQIPSTQLYPANSESAKSEHVKNFALVSGRVRAIVSIPHIVEAIKKRCGKTSDSKE
jgi:chemotaxis signal transduction protein